MTEALDSLLDALRELDPTLRTLIAGIGMFLETSILIGLVIPGDSIALLASAGVTSSSEFLWLLFALVLGALAGETTGFFLGRLLGPRLRHSWVGKKIGARNWAKAEHYLGERGGIAVFLSRFLPVLHSVVPITAGMTGMRFRVFMLASVPASLIWATIVVSIGSSAAVGYSALAGRVKWAGFALVGAVLLVLVLVWLGKRALFRRERAYMQPLTDTTEVPESEGGVSQPLRRRPDSDHNQGLQQLASLAPRNAGPRSMLFPAPGSASQRPETE